MDRIINVKVGGNHLSKDNKNAGVKGEANVTCLRITFDEGWDGYAKTVTFWDALGKNPVKRTLTVDLLENANKDTRVYLVPIPAEPMAEAGTLTFVVDGYVDGKRQRSISDKLEVKDAPITDNAGEPADPTPTQTEQLQKQIDGVMGEIQKSFVAAEEAEQHAKTAEEFKGYAERFAEEALSSETQAMRYREQARGAAEKAENALGKASYIGENGNWFAWSIKDNKFYDTGVRAQSGSEVYVGENPPDSADVWIDPYGESAIFTPYIGDNGNWYIFDHETQTFVDSGENAVVDQKECEKYIDEIVSTCAWVSEVDMEKATEIWGSYFSVGDKIVDFRQTVLCAENEGDEPVERVFTYADVVSGDIEMYLNMARDDIENTPGDYTFDKVESLPYEIIATTWIWDGAECKIINTGKFTTFEPVDDLVLYYEHKIPLKDYTLQTFDKINTENLELKEKVNTVESIAKGANQAVSFDDYAEMIETLNSDGEPKYNIGQNIYIKTVEVPDLWISGTFPQAHEYYEYTTDEAFVERLKDGVGVQIGVYRVSQLETQKVDLTNVPKKDEVSYAVSFKFYDDVIASLNNAPKDKYNKGQIFIIETNNCQPLFVKNVFDEYEEFTEGGTSLALMMQKSMTAKVGYFEISPVPSYVDLKNYATTKAVEAYVEKQLEGYATNSALSEVESIAKGANQAVSFANYAEMINHLESLNADVYKTGQNIYIKTLDVPDLWVSGIEEFHEMCIYTTEEDFVNALKGGSIKIGYYTVSQLETQKVDLTDYAKKEELPTKESLGLYDYAKSSSFGDYEALVNHLNNSPKGEYKQGQPFMIVKKGVPDVWLIGIAESPTPYVFTTEEDFIKELKTEPVGVLIGYYCVTPIEVDLSGCATKEEVGDIETALDNIIAEQEAIITIQNALIGGDSV